MALPVLAQKAGQTLFGEDQKETLKAMRAITKALDVNCTYCHLKEGGKVTYSTDTPHKIIARQMKLSLVDSLVHKGSVQVKFGQGEEEMKVLAVYKATGQDPGIHLTATAPDDKRYQTVVALPEKGDPITCMTCHNRKVHFLSRPGEER